MKDNIEKAINALTKKISTDISATDASLFAKAALDLGTLRATLAHTDKRLNTP